MLNVAALLVLASDILGRHQLSVQVFAAERELHRLATNSHVAPTLRNTSLNDERKDRMQSQMHLAEPNEFVVLAALGALGNDGSLRFRARHDANKVVPDPAERDKPAIVKAS